MKITGTSNCPSMSLTASMPELPSRKLNIGEDQPGAFAHRDLHGLFAGARNTANAVSKTADDVFDIHRDQWLVFDHQHIGGDHLTDLAACLFEKLANARGIRLENFGGLIEGKPSTLVNKKAWRGFGGIAASGFARSLPSAARGHPPSD